MTQHNDMHLRLRECREYLGYTQKQVAEVLGIHRESYTEIEAGRRGVSIFECTKLSELFGVSPAYLINGHRPEQPVSANLRKLLDDPRLDNNDRNEIARFAEFLHFRKASQ